MGYTIVYDRLFLRERDKYIPICLYGSSNCTEMIWSGGRYREVLERSWDTFSYGDEMILGTEAEIMMKVRSLHVGDRSENFKFHGGWLDDHQVVSFFRNGIKNAVTVEELKQQARITPTCRISYYTPETETQPVYGEHRTSMEEHPKTSDELAAWVVSAKAEKARLIASGEAKSVYLCIGFSGREPIRACPAVKIDGPCVAKGKHGWIVSVDNRGASFNPDRAKARVFANSEEAYLYCAQYPYLGAVRVSAKTTEKPEKPSNIVLSVTRGGVPGFYVHRLTRNTLHYVYNAAYAKKRFKTEAAAMSWYARHVEGRFEAVSDPKPVRLEVGV